MSRPAGVVLAIASSAAVVGALLIAALSFGDNANAYHLGPFNPGNEPFHVELTGAAEAPGPGDPDGSGFAIIEASRDMVCFKIFVTGVAPLTAAHIHEAPAGVAGPVVVPLAPLGANIAEGCVSSGEVSDIVNNPEDYYVNVHNAPFPDGALRGQLR